MHRLIAIIYIAFLGAVSSFSPSSTTILSQPRQHNLVSSLKLNNDSTISASHLNSRLYMSDAAGSYLDSLSAKSNEVGEEEKVCIRYAHKICSFCFCNICLTLSHSSLNNILDWQDLYMVNTPTRSYSIHINITKLSLCIHPTRI